MDRGESGKSILSEGATLDLNLTEASSENQNKASNDPHRTDISSKMFVKKSAIMIILFPDEEQAKFFQQRKHSSFS